MNYTTTFRAKDFVTNEWRYVSGPIVDRERADYIIQHPHYLQVTGMTNLPATNDTIPGPGIPFTTEMVVEMPRTKEIIRTPGPDIMAISKADAEDVLDRMGLTFLKIAGELTALINEDTGQKISVDTYRWN